MAQKIFDLSGAAGLLERHQGDLNTSTSSPNLRYIGKEGQMADGIYNSYKKMGYLSPANNSFTTLSGTIADSINAICYDSNLDDLYFVEEGQNILKLDGLDDTSLVTDTTISTGTIKDALIYEINGSEVLLYSVDSGATGSYVGFKTINDGVGLTIYDPQLPKSNANVISSTASNGLGYAAGSTTFFTTSRGLAQSFDTDDIASFELSGTSLWLKRTDGTGVGITLKVSIREDSDKTEFGYTDQGAWVTATSYAVGDIVTDDSIDYVCFNSHTSDALSRPSNGGDNQTYWSLFNSPSDTDLTSATVSLDEITDDTTLDEFDGAEKIEFNFSSTLTLDPSTRYWIVLEEQGSNMTASDTVTWVSTPFDETVVTDQAFVSYVDTLDIYGESFLSLEPTQQGTAHFLLHLNNKENWSAELANGNFTAKSGEEQFLYLADNALVYWFVGNDLHTIDGSVTGGALGRVIENVISFPEYIRVRSVAETRSRMFIGIQTAVKSGNSTQNSFSSKRAGVYVWDRRSQVLGSTDFYPAPGAQDIKALFPNGSGDVVAISLSNNGFTELRAISGNSYGVMQTMEKDAHPLSYRGVSYLNTSAIWLGQNNIVYSYGTDYVGAPASLKKIADLSSEVDSSFVAGPVFVGNKVSGSVNQPAVFFAWSDATSGDTVQKWYPLGEGTIDSTSQVAHAGNIYTQVEYITPMSTVRDVTVYCIPTTVSDDTVIATVKLYKNQSSTPFSTKSIKNSDTSRGYVRFDLNEQYTNSVQMEIEYATTEIDGINEFYPSLAILNYDTTNTNTKDKG